MNNFLMCLLALATAFSIGFASYLYSPTGAAEAKGFSLLSEYHRAIIYKDGTNLRKFVSDDFQSFGNGHLYRFRNGKPISKAKKRFIASLKNANV
ncbi:MAG: hypothetical protein H7Z37_07650, partial [Pyrinomonadaceae bacterium]|nr:hypothetical protein [Pyrinomonadaceae bacterium]